MKITSVRLRLMMWNISILVVVLFGFLFAAHAVIRGSMLSSLDSRLKTMGERQARLMSRIDRDRPAPPEGIRRWRGNSRFPRMTRLFDRAGHPILSNGQPASTQDAPWDRATLSTAANGLTTFSMVQMQDEVNTPMRVLSRPLYHEGKQIGVMQVAISFAEMQILLDSLTKMLLLLIPCALLIAGVSGLFLTNRALQPVRQILAAAEMMHPEDLSQRLPVVGADEFALLASTMNGKLTQVEEAFARLRQSIDRERRFTADASHELRTPLTAIKANASLALKGERTPEQYRESLQAIHQASESMHRLVQDLLLLARSDSGQLTLQQQEIEPEGLLEDAILSTQRDEDQPSVHLTVAPGTGAIWGDPYHLSRLVNNLLDNALRHTPAEGEVTLEAREEDNRIVLTVTDTGEGIAPEHLPHLGERFYRIDAARARQHGGAGLGLAICRSIVEAHHGAMTIESTLGEGTRVTVVLPKMQGEDSV
ncbi:MAG: ATP-binding protein [Armatimonadota bacterium]